jgi:hypothetical protein
MFNATGRFRFTLANPGLFRLMFIPSMPAIDALGSPEAKHDEAMRRLQQNAARLVRRRCWKGGGSPSALRAWPWCMVWRRYWPTSKSKKARN